MKQNIQGGFAGAGLVPYDPEKVVSKLNVQFRASIPPTSMLAVDGFTKGTMTIMHEVALLRGENSSLHKANEERSKRRRAKKTHMRLGGSLTVQDAQDLLDQKAMGEQVI